MAFLAPWLGSSEASRPRRSLISSSRTRVPGQVFCSGSTRPTAPSGKPVSYGIRVAGRADPASRNPLPDRRDERIRSAQGPPSQGTAWQYPRAYRSTRPGAGLPVDVTARGIVMFKVSERLKAHGPEGPPEVATGLARNCGSCFVMSGSSRKCGGNSKWV